MESKDNKNRGRPIKLTDQELMNIIDIYMKHRYEINGSKINGRLLAKFANELEKIYPDNEEYKKKKYKMARYYDFTQREISNKEIEQIKGERRGGLYPKGGLYYQSININNIIERVKNSPSSLKDILERMQEAEYYQYQNAVKYERKYVDAVAIIREQEIELKNNDELINNLRSEIKFLKQEKKDLVQKNKQLKKVIEVDNHIAVLKWTRENSLLDGNLMQQYKTTLLACGVVKEKDFSIPEQKVESNSNDRSFNVTEFRDKMLLREQQEMEKAHEESLSKENNKELTASSLRKRLNKNQKI